MLDVGVGEAVLDSVKTCLFAEAEVVDFVAIVKLDPFAIENLNHVIKCVVADVEVSRHTEHFDEALEAAALFQVNLFLDALEQGVAVHVAIGFCLDF